MDWVDEFVKRFGMFREVKTLAGEHFYGTVEINFHDGVPTALNTKTHRNYEKINSSNK